MAEMPKGKDSKNNYRDSKPEGPVSKQVTWCFTPSQPVQLYQSNPKLEKVSFCMNVLGN